MKEAYVSYKIAKLLKEKCFDWFTYSYYTKDDVDKKPYFGIENLCPGNWNGEVDEVNDLWFSAPTQQMACRWLREEYYIDVLPLVRHVNKFAGELPIKEYSYRIYDSEGNVRVSSRDWFRSYEKSIETALEYVLKNLI